MAQIFDKTRGCLPVTPYLILVTEDTTVTVGEGACTVTITAAEGQRVVWTDSTAKLTLSTDSARYEQLPKSAPLPIGSTGQGGTPLSPAELAALTNLVGGTISANGSTLTFKLTRDQKKLVTLTGLDELNTGGAPINTLNGNVYHGSGSANFTQTISGQVFSTSIDAHHVECRWNGALKVHLHADANGNAVLELNGERVLTESNEALDHLAKMVEIRTLMEAESSLYGSVAEFGAAHGAEFVNGEDVMACNLYNTFDDPQNVTAKKAFLHFGKVNTNHTRIICDVDMPNADVVAVSHDTASLSIPLSEAPTSNNVRCVRCKTLTVYSGDATSISADFLNCRIWSGETFEAFPIRIFLPKVTSSLGSGAMFSSTHTDLNTLFTRTLRDVKVYAPSMNKTSYFFARGTNSAGTRMGFAPPISAESVIYLFNNLPNAQNNTQVMNVAIAANVLIDATQAEVDAGLAANIGDRCPQAGTPLGDATLQMIRATTASPAGKGWIVNFDESDYE